jgi:hypothetical protein
MHLRISLLFLFLCFSCAVFGQSLTQLEGIDLNQADFYIFDVTDQKKSAFPSVDAYEYQENLYIALTPLFEGLRVKYSLIGNTLTVEFDGKSTQLTLTQQSSDQGQWFNDGSFYFIQSEIIEQLFSTKISIQTNSLKLDLTGHLVDFPYKLLNKRQKQRQINNFLVQDRYESKGSSLGVITVPDQYRLATVPTGYLNLEYQENDIKQNFRGVLQTVSDLAYHSANITVSHDSDQTNSRVEFTRYPQFPGDKILGIWDKYSFGDIWLNRSNLVSGSSRGLGLKFSANNINNQHENMTTNFVITAKPGWEADIYHNSIFLESRVVPNDGLMEFKNMELQYGANEFKIVLYGPYGEQETIYERVSVRQNSLAQGDTAFGLSFVEQDSSLLDIDLSEFNIDDISANFNVGLFDNWQIGATVNIQDINDNNSAKSLLLKNQVTLPGWFFENQLSLSEEKFTQNTTLATSFTTNDNFTLQYQTSVEEFSGLEDIKRSNLYADYNIRTGSVVNSLSYEETSLGVDQEKTAKHRISTFLRFFNISNSLIFRTNNNVDDSLTGSLNISARVNENFRFNSTIPYDLRADEQFDSESISASMSYNFRDNSDNRHVFNLSNTSFFKDNKWSVGYNLAVLADTHQINLRTNYNSSDKWQVTAGISVNFGYDYFNNRIAFSNQSMRAAGTLDVYTYLDRHLNGIPDELDYDLPDVTFSGKNHWDSVITNSDGRARLFGANTGITALRAEWKTGGTTLNNDYLIYSHPGSVQKINLPFYLTTELEFFVVLINQDQVSSLGNVPIIVSNLSTGDEYQSESDFDGYVSFIGLMPGNYQVKIEQQFLTDKGLQADVGGFEFYSPLKGGFVLLPNIELTRSESGEIGANKLLKIDLDDDNYVPIMETENDKLIHLPPKGAMKAPYSLDALHLAKFKEIKMQSTAQERKELRDKLTKAAVSSPSYQNILPATSNDPVKTSAVLLSEGELQVSKTPATELVKVEVTENSNLINSPAQEKPLTAETILESMNDKPIELRVLDTDSQLSTGYVVQYAALNDLNTAKRLTQNFTNIEQLRIVQKNINEKIMYCLVSQVFQEETSARQYLNRVEKNGFIVNTEQYLKVIWSK